MDLPTALDWTLQCNPDLIAVRQNLPVSAAAVEVARRFPTSINPTVSVDVRPWTFERLPGGGASPLETLVGVTWAQPIELGHRQAYRQQMARAAYTQTQWNILQAELAALVETYRVHQTATYRRGRLEVAERLVAFNEHLLDVLRRQEEANQVPAADVVLGEVESQSTSQALDVARQEYVAALTALRRQIGIAEYAGSAEPAGDLQLPEAVLPGSEEALIRTALESRPEIRAAQAQVASSQAAVCLARADRIPIPSVGPVYEKDESGTTFYGLACSTPVPLLNAGNTLVCQREAEYHRDCVVLEQLRQRTAAQVRAALIQWNEASRMVARTQDRMAPILAQAERMDRLYEAGQTDVVRLLQVRQRTIEAENAQLDALWQATQAYADLLSAVGAAPLIGSVPAQGAAVPGGPSGQSVAGRPR